MIARLDVVSHEANKLLRMSSVRLEDMADREGIYWYHMTDMQLIYTLAWVRSLSD